MRCTHALLGAASGALMLLSAISAPAEAASRAATGHAYATSDARELVNTIAVSTSTLLPLVPPGYNIVPAATLGVGSSTQGIVVVVNFQGYQPVIDRGSDGNTEQTDIDVGILVAEPADAALASVNLPGAFHFYTLAVYTDDSHYADSLERSIPVEFIKHITYDRQYDDATGFGTLAVNIPDRDSPISSINNAFGYELQTGALDAVFWHNGNNGKSVLHFHNQPFLSGQALSQVYTRPGTWLGKLLLGAGSGACPTDAVGNACVQTPSLNLRYPAGTRGQLSFIKDS